MKNALDEDCLELDLNVISSHESIAEIIDIY